MGNSLLWVYEGQTQYWGFVLTARAGMWTPQEFRDGLAMVAANYDRNREGFQWRSLEDTTNDPVVARRAPLPYRSWQMSEDYYSGGQMMWLAVDAKLRSLTGDKRSLDDFARAFFGVDDGSHVPKTYTFDDVVAALNDTAKYDWASFLKAMPLAHSTGKPRSAGRLQRSRTSAAGRVAGPPDHQLAQDDRHGGVLASVAFHSAMKKARLIAYYMPDTVLEGCNTSAGARPIRSLPL